MVAILALLAVVAVPAAGWVGDIRRDMHAARLQAAFTFAHQWALGSGDATWVEFDDGLTVVRVFVEDPESPGKADREPLKHPLNGGPLTVSLPEGLVEHDELELGGGLGLRFDGDGVPQAEVGVALSSDAVVSFVTGQELRVTEGTGLVLVE